MSRLVRLAVCLVALLLTGGAFAQDPESQTDEKTPETASATAAPVAYVYVQTTPGVMVYSAAANGTLTEVKGSPFKVTGQMEDIGGKFLISVGTTILHTYQIESNGAVGKQISEINTASFNFGTECGTTSGQGSVLDHTGKYLYVKLGSNNLCSAWQSYQLESDGSLRFLEAVYSEEHDSNNNLFQSTVPTISSNDKFAYGVWKIAEYTGDHCDGVGLNCPELTPPWRISGGVLGQCATCAIKNPEAPSGFTFIPSPYSSPRADANGHFAVLMAQLDSSGNFNGPPLQLASYSINPSSGSFSSSNTYHNMPTVTSVEDTQIAMAMSPSGNLLAVAGWSGLQIFHFNGAAPPTKYSGLIHGLDFEQVMWDDNNHLYVVSTAWSQMNVYTVTPTSITEAPGSPYSLPQYPYGTKELIVVPK